MVLPSLDRFHREVERLQGEAEEPVSDKGYPFGYVPPEVEPLYREWYERDPGAALAWRMQQPGFDIREVIRICAEREDEIRERIKRRRETERRRTGE